MPAGYSYDASGGQTAAVLSNVQTSQQLFVRGSGGPTNLVFWTNGTQQIVRVSRTVSSFVYVEPSGGGTDATVTPDIGVITLGADVSSVKLDATVIGVIGTMTLGAGTSAVGVGVSPTVGTVTLSSASATYSAQVLADSPVGYWRLGESSGVTAADSSTTANDGTYVNTPTLATAGLLTADSNTAATFTSASLEDVTIGDHAAYDVNDVFTIEAWVKTSTADFMGVFCLGGVNGPYMRVNSDGTVGVLKSTVAAIASSTVTVADGLPHHVAWTKNGATNKIYVDGVDCTGAVTNATPSNPTTTSFIGSQAGGEFFNGVIDEAALYATALSAARILAHYTTGASGPGTTVKITVTPTIGTLTLGAPTSVVGVTVAPTIGTVTLGAGVPVVTFSSSVSPTIGTLTLGAGTATVTTGSPPASTDVPYWPYIPSALRNRR